VTETTRVGRAQRFRQSGGLERCVRRISGHVPGRVLPILRRCYEASLDRLPGDRLLSTLPGGERVRLSARHRYLGWNPEEYAAFRSAVRPGDVVIEAGANVGAYTLLFAQWVGSSGRVFAFEPAPDARSWLERHLRLNGLSDRVEVIAAAIAARDGVARLGIDPLGGASSLFPRDAASGIQVRTTSIDMFCDERQVQPNVIKIDVEGAELEALEGAHRTIAGAPVLVFVEFHPAVWKARGIGRADLEREMRAQGLFPEPLDPAFDVWATEGVCARLCRS
jgi:FkbM family methyltransferase